MSFRDDLRFEKDSPRRFSSDSFTTAPLYTIDKAKNLVGKEFTFKGKQVVVTKADKDTIELAPVLRGKPVDRAAFEITRKELSRAVKHQYEDKQGDDCECEENECGDGKCDCKCSCLRWPYDCDSKCCRHGHFLLAPFYGRGDGKSAAEINTGEPGQKTGQGPAYPGPGGINMPGIPPGPNSGMGPIGSNKEFSGRSIMEDIGFMKSISEKSRRR